MFADAWATCVSKRENHSTNNAFWLVESRDVRHLLLSPPGGIIYFTPTWGVVLIRDGGLFERWVYLRGGLMQLQKAMVSVNHKELEYKVEKRRGGG